MCSFVIALAGAARADDPLPTFLEQRIPEELATEGVVLSRANLALKVEQVGDKLLVSLVDLSTGRVAASTKIDQVPADRDAAVASVTHVAAELAAQAMQRPIAPPAAPGQTQVDPARREVDELRFHREALWFPPEHGTTQGPVDSQHWRVFQGDSDQLDPVDFYKRVGRDDLGAEYLHRRRIMLVTGVTGLVAVLASGALLVKVATTSADCTPCVMETVEAKDRAMSTYGPWIAALLAGGAATFFVGSWYGGHLQPISEREAKSLADQYNQGLRRNLGLPVVERRRLRDLQIAPFVSGHDGGLVLGARF